MQQRIRADNLCKNYGRLRALEQASLLAYAGECLGIFGLSGAGKSALLRILAGIEPPDSGSVSRSDDRPGILLQSPTADIALTPAEFLWLHAAFYEIPRGKRHAAVREVLSLVGLDERREHRIGALPDGARKLLEIAGALLSPSDLLLLDEPMAGLDYDARIRLWEHLLRLRTHEKKTVILATSRAEEAELCDRIALLHEGRILAVGTAAQLRSIVGPEALTIKLSADKSSRRGRGWSGIVGREQDGSLVVEMCPESRPAELMRQISGDVAAVRIKPRGLDSVLSELLARPELLAAWRDGD